jgi:hypothetical protein
MLGLRTARISRFQLAVAAVHRQGWRDPLQYAEEKPYLDCQAEDNARTATQNDDAVSGSGARLRLLPPVPVHQRVQVFLRTESPRIPAADSPRVDSHRQWRSNFSNTLRRSRAITTYRCICELQRKKPMEIPAQAEIEDKLRSEDLNTWLDLWRAEQGPAKPGALKLIAAVIPFPTDESLRVWDVGCGCEEKAGRSE